jgi:hypothetical protein
MGKPMTAQGFKAAIAWMVMNDDTYWLDDEYGSISVTACLVADIYGKTDEEVTQALRAYVKKHGRGSQCNL